VNKPSILLADEPTGNLDSRTGEEIKALFADSRRRATPSSLVTHEEDNSPAMPAACLAYPRWAHRER